MIHVVVLGVIEEDTSQSKIETGDPLWQPLMGTAVRRRGRNSGTASHYVEKMLVNFMSCLPYGL